VTRDVGKYVEGCDLCQRMKNRTEEPAGKLKLSEVPQRTWTHLTVDFIMKLPVVAGKDVILVICDRLSKITHFVATTEETSVEELARLFQDNVWKLHGLPESVVSDKGPQFVAELTKELNRMLGIKTKLSTAFHPQTDGQTERMNQEVEQYLRFFIKHRQKDWCYIQVHLSGKLHPRSDATSKPYKPAFHGSHLSRNTSYGGAATLRVFRLPWRRYSYSTQSSMTELLLSVSQH